MSPEIEGAFATLIGAVATAILMAAAYYFPRGHSREEDDHQHDHDQEDPS